MFCCARGGLTTYENIEIIHHGANLRKGSKLPDEFEEDIANGICKAEIGLDAKSLLLWLDAILDSNRYEADEHALRMCLHKLRCILARKYKRDGYISDIQGQLYGMESDPVAPLLRFESFHDQQYMEVDAGLLKRMFEKRSFVEE